MHVILLQRQSSEFKRQELKRYNIHFRDYTTAEINGTSTCRCKGFNGVVVSAQHRRRQSADAFVLRASGEKKVGERVRRIDFLSTTVCQ